jgi:hypothetical protein
VAGLQSSGKYRALLVVSIAVISFIVALGILYMVGSRPPKGRQAEFTTRGGTAAPFDRTKTKQMFQLLLNGGLQTVTVLDVGDAGQIGLVQGQLQDDAERFQRGDFSDPLGVRGADLPGAAELKVNAKQITIRYYALADGGQIEYVTANPELVHAIHSWLMAQLQGNRAAGS